MITHLKKKKQQGIKAQSDNLDYIYAYLHVTLKY